MFKHSYKNVDAEDIHIKILRYALANPAFTHGELIKELSLTYDQQVFIGTEVSSSSVFFTRIGSKTDGAGQSSGYKYMLSFEGRSRLLEYDELKEARQNALGAFWMALLALIVSSVGVFFQVLCG